MPKTIYSNGSRAYAPWFNAIQALVFDDQDIDGHYPRLFDDSLSNDPTQIKPQWQSFRDSLLVSAGTGLSINYLGGVAVLPNGVRQAIAPGTLVIPNNQTSTVYVTTSGTVAVGVAAALPLSRLDLASVTTAAGVISGVVTDLRPRFLILPRIDALKVFGGSGDQGNYTLNTGSATFADGDYYYNNFTIGAPATLTISRSARIFVAGNCAIAGSVVITQASNGGGSYIGNGGGGASSAQGRLTGNGFGAGSGGSAGNAYNYTVSLLGSGGASGGIFPTAGTTADVGIAGAGGSGGGALSLEVAGTVSITGTITAQGGSGTAPSVSSGSPSLSGSGGGSGGLILVRSNTSIVVTGTLDVRGGAGGNGSGVNASGGGGGAGGQVVLIAPSINTTGSTIQLTGGAGGTPSGSNGGGGGAGFGGTGGNGFASAGGAGLFVTRSFRPVG